MFRGNLPLPLALSYPVVLVTLKTCRPSCTRTARLLSNYGRESGRIGRMRRYNPQRHHKTFEDPELVAAVVNLWWATMGFATVSQAARVMGVTRFAIWRWRHGKARPDTTALRRMCRLVAWQIEAWPAKGFAAVDWDELDVELAEGHEHRPNPFYLTLPREDYDGRKFPFGTLQDSAAVLRFLLDHCGVQSRGHLASLLGMPRSSSGRDHLRHWMASQWAIGPQYLVRVLALLLWAAAPEFEYEKLEDLWAVDWTARTVELTNARRLQFEGADGWPVTLPNPFRRLASYRSPAIPPRKLNSRAAWVEPVAIRSYDPRAFDAPSTVAEAAV